MLCASPHEGTLLPMEVICTEILRHMPDTWEWLFVCRATNAVCAPILRQRAKSLIDKVIRDDDPALPPRRCQVICVAIDIDQAATIDTADDLRKIEKANPLVGARGKMPATVIPASAIPLLAKIGYIPHYIPSVSRLRASVRRDIRSDILIYYPANLFGQIVTSATYAPEHPAIARYAEKIYTEMYDALK